MRDVIKRFKLVEGSASRGRAGGNAGWLGRGHDMIFSVLVIQILFTVSCGRVSISNRQVSDLHDDDDCLIEGKEEGKRREGTTEMVAGSTTGYTICV